METFSLANSYMSRPLCRVYRAMHFEVLRVRIGEDGVMSQTECLWALGVQASGRYETLGTWPLTGASLDLWQVVREDLRSRGVEKFELVHVHGLAIAGTSSTRLRGIADAQEVVRHLQRGAVRAIRKRGTFSDMTEARAYVAGVLDRLEQALGDVDLKEAIRRLACPATVRPSVRRVSGRTH